jgi:hypothetical protein
MSSAVIAVLAVVVGLHLLLTFSLIARVRALQEMLQPELVPLPAPGTAVSAETPPALPLVAFVTGVESDPAARMLLSSLATVGRAAYARAGDAAHQAFRPTAFPSLYRIENGQIAAAGHTLGDVLR